MDFDETTYTWLIWVVHKGSNRGKEGYKSIDIVNNERWSVCICIWKFFLIVVSSISMHLCFFDWNISRCLKLKEKKWFRWKLCRCSTMLIYYCSVVYCKVWCFPSHEFYNSSWRKSYVCIYKRSNYTKYLHLYLTLHVIYIHVMDIL